MSRRRRTQQAGFTLIELLVAMVAGLAVALAVVALSRDATGTFHEEARTATAEMSLRLAVDRLRADLQRAGFMATGNVQKDVLVPLDPTQTRVRTAVTGHVNLQALHILQQGSLALTPLSTAGSNALAPDALEITGNLTSTDQYVVRTVTDGGSACGGQRMFLATDSASMYRIVSNVDPGALLRRMFQPVAGQKFLVRVADDLGRYEFAVGCAAGIAHYDPSAPDATKIYIDLDPAVSIDVTRYGFVDGRLSVNPVATVRWEIRPLDNVTYPMYAGLGGDSGVDGQRYDLIRSYVDITTGDPFTPDVTVDGSAPEIVAEYAVDLKFAFTADIGDYTGTIPSPNLQTWAFGDTKNDDLTKFPPSAATAVPQRARSVRYRVSTRTAVPDRSLDLRLPQDNYTVRYCMDSANNCTGTSKESRFARVRTVTTEVALTNLAKAFY